MTDFSPTNGDTTATTQDFATGGHPIVHPATVERPATRSPWRLTTIALLLALFLGGLLGAWLVTTVPGSTDSWFGASDAPATAPAQPAVAAPVAATPAIVTLAPPPPPGAAIDTRVAILEERLARINIAAESASGNAARAESLLVAFGARRAIDRGLPLGVMEAQLRLRFGETQPNAVRSILDAANSPVTIEMLRRRLSDLRPLAIADNGADWFSRIGTRLSRLTEVRPANAVSASPADRFRHALTALDNGQLEVAIDDVAALPGREAGLVRSWSTDARRLNDARRALDIIETAAILEPAENRTPEVVAPAR